MSDTKFKKGDRVEVINNYMCLDKGVKGTIYRVDGDGYPLISPDNSNKKRPIMEHNLKLIYEDQDPVNHPDHYTSHPSGVECIEVTEHMGFCMGNAMKYIWRADLKGDAIQDLEKAKWYIERELKKRND